MTEVKNFVWISPHYPKNFIPFILRLNAKGINVLGIGDEPYDHLSQELKEALTEYYRVDDMEDYEQMYKAMAFLSFKHGKIDRVESNNEYWLETDARLRTDFNVPGLKIEEMDAIKHKSAMKQVFRRAKIPVAKGRVVVDKADAQKFIRGVRYPVIIKPNSGVGASDTWKINNSEELDRFYEQADPKVTYIIEQYIKGDLVTYDGLTDQEGNIVFDSSLIHNKPILDIVSSDSDMYFMVVRDIPEKLRELGQKAVQAFNIKERFFHFEFFQLEDGSFYGLELNDRAPGGATVDLWNYANDFDIFEQYANIVKENTFTADIKRTNNVTYQSRRDEFDYQHSVEDIKQHYPDEFITVVDNAKDTVAVMGEHGVITKSPDQTRLHEVMAYVTAKK